jgi:hypothetical protein
MQFELDNPFIKDYHIQLNYAVIEYKRKKYIISTTHNYPFINDNIKPILWNELLIMENVHELQYKIYELQYKIPCNKILVILEAGNTIYELSIDEALTLMSFDGINNIYIPYITATFKEKIKNPDLLRGLSGSPIFIINRYHKKNNKKIIGIFSQFNIHTNQAYIIPSYLIKKTLDRKDNLNVYTLPNIETIKKIGRFNISNGNIIFHHIFGNIPISTFLLIEGDCNKDMIIQELEYPLSSKIITENEFNIDKQKMETFFIVNSKLVSILKKMKKYDIVKDILSNKLKKIKISL